MVAPLSLLNHWEKEATKRISPALNVLVYYEDGILENPSVEDLGKYDLVITTYGVVRSEYRRYITTRDAFDQDRPIYPNNRFSLLAAKWNLVVLEEGHRATYHKTATTRALMELDSARRLVVTSTPLMNDYGDVQSLMKFLRIDPWDDPNHFAQVILCELRDRGAMLICTVFFAQSGRKKDYTAFKPYWKWYPRHVNACIHGTNRQ